MRFMYSNLWDSGTLTYSKQHPNFPATNTRHRWHTRTWRSRYGAASSWGNFVIEAGVNDKIDFEETNGVELTATLTASTYNADTLASHIETKLEAVGASNYTVTYSDSTNKFTLASDGAGGGGIFKLRWNTGTNAATSVGTAIGFNVDADDSGALSYTADYLRIHTEEWLKLDRGGSTPAITAIIIKYNNFSTSATIQVQGNATDAWASPTYNQVITLDNDVMAHFPSSAQSLRWWRIRIRDVSNSDTYVEMGRVFLGTYFEPTQEVHINYELDPTDPSLLTFSEGGQLSTIQKTHFENKNYYFPATDEKSSFETVFNSRGTTKDLFICIDESVPNDNTFYVRIIQWDYIHMIATRWRIEVSFEELR